jgi:hypothetical protein
MKIEILYISGCPHHGEAVTSVREILAEEGDRTTIDEVEVKDDASAQRSHFLGSPSIRIDGVDVERAATDSRSYGLTCRTYSTESGYSGTPPREWVRTAIREALHRFEKRGSRE